MKRLLGDNSFQVPQDIVKNATTLDTNYTFFRVEVEVGPNRDPKNLQLLYVFHFAEINNDNRSRRFDIYRNNELLFPDFSPSRFHVDSMHENGRFIHNAATSFSFLLNKTRRSMLPPLINAFELYSVIRMDNLFTDSNDGEI